MRLFSFPSLSRVIITTLNIFLSANSDILVVSVIVSVVFFFFLEDGSCFPVSLYAE